MSLRSVKFGVTTASGMQTGHELRFDRDTCGGVSVMLYEDPVATLPYFLKEFTAEEWAIIVAAMSRAYNDASYCEAVDRQLPYEQSAHEKANRLARRIAK